MPSRYKQNSNAGGVLGMIQEIIDESAGGERRRGRLQPTATFHISGVLVLFSVLNVFFFAAIRSGRVPERVGAHCGAKIENLWLKLPLQN